MCGIAGIFNFNNNLRHDSAIRAMTDRIAHRGPDAEGIFVDDHIALGHRRLSIIDLQEISNQPMWDATGRFGLVYNGEIYNYLEVKAELHDYPFKTQSDSEVILAAYNTWGKDCVKKFNGMFAIAIWDRQEKELFIARDRLGKKPLYYFQDENHFLFSSEVRSLMASGLVPRKLEENHLAEFLEYQAAMGDHTMVQGVKRLRAGYTAIINKDGYSTSPYWSYDVPLSGDNANVAKRKIKDLLLDAVRIRMISDVPLGAFLSGGIDSSLIVACMAEQSDAPVNTFTVSFSEKKFDESDFAQKIATQYNTNHHRILLSPGVFLDSMENILSAMDTPSGDGPNTYIVSKYTREAGIKVALSGLGGDELFVGYNKFLMFHRLMRFRWLMKIPGGLRHIVAERFLNNQINHQAGKFAELLDLQEWNLSTIYPVLRKAYSNQEILRILKTPIGVDQVQKELALIERQVNHMGSFSKCTIAEIETYTRDVLLRDTDQMAMTHALEVRAPFFDYRLVEYLLSLPDKIKYPHTPKQLLVEAMSPRLPLEISQRKKMGFSLPWENWLRHELSDMATQRIQYLADRKEFNGDEILKKWNDFKDGDRRILWSRIWKLVVLSDWIQRNNM